MRFFTFVHTPTFDFAAFNFILLSLRTPRLPTVLLTTTPPFTPLLPSHVFLNRRAIDVPVEGTLAIYEGPITWINEADNLLYIMVRVGHVNAVCLLDHLNCLHLLLRVMQTIIETRPTLSRGTNLLCGMPS